MIDITTTLGGIETAINMVKTIIKSDSLVKEANLKNELSKIMNLLSDSQLEVAKIKTEIIEKDKTINNLEERIQKILSKEKPILKSGCYLFEGDDSLYCTVCWTKDKNKIPTTHYSLPGLDLRTCPCCKANFGMD